MVTVYVLPILLKKLRIILHNVHVQIDTLDSNYYLSFSLLNVWHADRVLLDILFHGLFLLKTNRQVRSLSTPLRYLLSSAKSVLCIKHISKAHTVFISVPLQKCESFISQRNKPLRR